MKRNRLVWACIVGAALVLAFSARFIQDDAFISLRYARNLADGHGLVFNPGERVPGYSNFLWTLLLALPHRVGVDAIAFAHAAGLLCLVGTLFATRALARAITGNEHDSLLAAALLASSYTFLCYATGGLETQLQTCLVTTVAWLALGGVAQSSLRGAAAMSFVAGLAMLTRLDSSLLVAPLCALALLRVVRATQVRDAAQVGGDVKLGPAPSRWLASAILPGGVLVVTFLIWMKSYYGVILPNTLAVKGLEASAFGMGAGYLYQFVRSYWLAPVLLVVALAPRPVRDAVACRVLVGLIVLWSTYLVLVGGDFMEFRLVVPVLPLLFTLIAATLPTDRRLRFALVASLLLGSLSHMRSYGGDAAIVSVRNLAKYVSAEGDDWSGAGRALGSLFRASDPQVVIAMTAAGAVPYYSGLPSIDMLGLTDAFVAHHGLFAGIRPGHRRKAPFSYLLSRGCNIVIGHPQVIDARPAPCDDPATMRLGTYGLRDVTPDTLPGEARVVLVPVREGRSLRALYVTPHPAIEAALASHAISACPGSPVE